MYEHSYFLNSILKEQVKQINDIVPKTYHWHAISIEELEYVLTITDTQDLFSYLREKRIDPYKDSMDFNDYHARNYSQYQKNNSYLVDVYERYFAELGLPVN
jgi:hypothetical protein